VDETLPAAKSPEARPPRRAKHRVLRFARWVGSHEPSVLVGLGLAAALSWAFVALADAIGDEPHRIDREIMLAMRTPGDPADPIGPRWVEEAARDVTALGGSAVLLMVSLAVVSYLLLRRDFWRATLVTGAVIGAQLLSAGLKYVIDRPRPDLVPAFAYVYNASFPSGHALLSAALYLTFATQLAEIQPSRVVRGYLIVVAIGFIIVIGLTRVYLGVHWPSDVLAGWAVGAAWALLMWGGARMYAAHRARQASP
jgi:undecaprenyl-diphosphatase